MLLAAGTLGVGMLGDIRSPRRAGRLHHREWFSQGGPATTIDVIDVAALACAIAMLSAVSAGLAAWFGLHDGLAQIHGDKVAFVVIALAFVTSALLALLNLQKDLTDI